MTAATRTFAARTGGLVAVVALLSGLTACAAEPSLKLVAPTMAPDQSVSEACAISGEEVDRITHETEEQIRQGVEQAGADLAAGRIPSFEFLAPPADEALAEVSEQISNLEVLDAIENVRVELQDFGEIERPESLLTTPGYIAALGSQLNDLAQAGKTLQGLCVQ